MVSWAGLCCFLFLLNRWKQNRVELFISLKIFKKGSKKTTYIRLVISKSNWGNMNQNITKMSEGCNLCCIILPTQINSLLQVVSYLWPLIQCTPRLLVLTQLQPFWGKKCLSHRITFVFSFNVSHQSSWDHQGSCGSFYPRVTLNILRFFSLSASAFYLLFTHWQWFSVFWVFVFILKFCLAL